MNDSARAALARTVDLIAMDVFNSTPGTDEALDTAIVEGLMSTTVRLSADVASLTSYAGQTNLVALFGLIGMMGIGIELDIPQVQLLGHQPPLRGAELRSALLSYGNDLIPSARVRTARGPVDLSFVLGGAPTAEPEAVVRVSGDAWRCQVGAGNGFGPWSGDWPFGALAAAGVAAAEAFRVALARILAATGRRAVVPGRFEFSFARRVRLDLFCGRDPVNVSLSNVDIVSGGAITTAALYSLTRIPSLSARFRVIEPEALDVSNLNRYLLARRSDCGRPKTAVLRAAATDSLEVIGIDERFTNGSALTLGSLAPRVLVGVDDIPSRWAVQRASTGWLCVAGTSHFFGLVTTHEPGRPCAGCVHPRDDELNGPIPTISFVSFWAGLLQARALLIANSGMTIERAMNVWPLGLDGVHGLHATDTAASADCPVRCAASAEPST